MCQDWLDLWYIRPPAPHILQHIGALVQGRLDLQDISTPLRGPHLGVELGFKLLDLGIYPGPPLTERCQPLSKALGVHAVLCVLSREMKVGDGT